MVAFTFNARFVLPIELGTKTQTIRTNRKRNSRPEDALQFFTGARMSPVRIGGALCVDAGAICLDLHHDTVEYRLKVEGHWMLPVGGLDKFAVADGFGDWEDLKDFWRETHDPREPWVGHITKWGSTFRGGALPQ